MGGTFNGVVPVTLSTPVPPPGDEDVGDNRPRWFYARRREPGVVDEMRELLTQLRRMTKLAGRYAGLRRAYVIDVFGGRDTQKRRQLAHEMREAVRALAPLADTIDPMEVELEELNPALRDFLKEQMEFHRASGLRLKRWVEQHPSLYEPGPKVRPWEEDEDEPSEAASPHESE